jgi:hypothetical protein
MLAEATVTASLYQFVRRNCQQSICEYSVEVVRIDRLTLLLLCLFTVTGSLHHEVSSKRHSFYITFVPHRCPFHKK